MDGSDVYLSGQLRQFERAGVFLRARIYFKDKELQTLVGD
jgi:hypothetical protein